MKQQLTTTEQADRKRQQAAVRQQRLRNKRSPYCVAFTTADSEQTLYLTAADKLSTLDECKQAGCRARLKTFATEQEAQQHIDSITALASAIETNKVYGIKQIVRGSAIKAIIDAMQAKTTYTLTVQAKNEIKKGETK